MHLASLTEGKLDWLRCERSTTVGITLQTLNTFFYPTKTSKMAAFVACWALRKCWNAAQCVVIIAKVKEPYFRAYDGSKSKKPCTFTGKIYFGVCGMQSHKMEMKYSDKGTLSPRSRNVQRQRYPLPRSLRYWPMKHCIQNTTSRRSVFEKLSNSEIIFSIIVSLKSGMENSIIQEFNAEADRIIANKLLPAKSRQRYK